MKFLAAMLLVFTALTAVMTYPQAFHLRDRVHDDGDPLLNAWALAWVAHQLPRAPAHLVDANIFYPERRTLAYSETLFVPAAVAAPLRWLGAGPLFVYNLVFLSGFVVSGAGTALLVRSLTNCTAAGLLAGIVFAFLPYRIDHFPHLQLQQTQCLPFAMWAFHRLLQTGRLRDGVLFGAFTAGQMLSCTYYGLFLIPYMAVVCGAMLIAERRLPNDRLIALVAAAAIVIAAVTPVGLAYLGARKVVGERGRQEVVDGSATWRNYLAPAEANALYGKPFARFMQSERRLFPGFVAIALAIVALFPSRTKAAETQPRRHEGTKKTFDGFVSSCLRGCIFVGSWFRGYSARLAYALGLLLAFDVSLGFNGLLYPALYEYFLPFRALRIPARMGLFVGFSLAVLAGYGIARIAGRVESAAARRVVFVAIGVLMLAEYASKPIELATIRTTAPEIYADIVRDRGDSPTAALFEFPSSSFDDPTYLYYSTFHWQNLVNGYSGFFPPSYVRLMDAMRGFPDDSSLAALRARGTRYLVVHGERLYGDRYETLIPLLDKRSDLALLSRREWFERDKHSEISAYRLIY
ncbi:MAG TPA: glycosyltransferase family 39 protein [Vicinamibacterales bacterium]|nr:glycosyltransferase family 39 protein [Vicinamibacterales bacterium]